MSYQVKGYGAVLLREDTPREVMKGFLDEFNPDFYKTKAGLEYTVQCDGGFDSDYAMEGLEALDPYTISGLIEMTGQDGDIWRYRFLEEYGKWVEESGIQVYQKYSEEDGTASYEPFAWVLVELGPLNSTVRIMETFLDESRAEAACEKAKKEASGSYTYELRKSRLMMW